jgi:hypothetical protein
MFVMNCGAPSRVVGDESWRLLLIGGAVTDTPLRRLPHSQWTLQRVGRTGGRGKAEQQAETHPSEAKDKSGP